MSLGGDGALELEEVSSGGIGRVVTTWVTVLEKKTSSCCCIVDQCLISVFQSSKASLTAPRVCTRRDILDRMSSGMLS